MGRSGAFLAASKCVSILPASPSPTSTSPAPHSGTALSGSLGLLAAQPGVGGSPDPHIEPPTGDAFVTSLVGTASLVLLCRKES